MTPHELTPMFPSLPPILYINYRIPISSYSKALRGLSVQSRVIRIFTYSTISPGPLLRQRPSRYAIRAGRNLPDKEFRYLRTAWASSLRPAKQAPLLPKLRGHFAEFLNKGSPVRLRIFSSPTCVGLRYGRLITYLATFLASVNSSTSLLVFTPRHHPALRRAYFTTRQPHDLAAAIQRRGSTILLCHCLI